MPGPLRITSRANPHVKQVLHLRTAEGRRQTGLLLAEGLREVRRALDAGLVPRELYVCPGLLRPPAAAIRPLVEAVVARPAAPGVARPAPPAHFEVGDAVFAKLAYQENPEGILAVFEQPRWRLAELGGGPADLWLVAVGATKPGNVGAMARTASAAGAAALLLADAVVDPWNPNAIRASTGAVFALPVVAAAGADLLAFLRTRAASIVAADPAARRLYTDVDLRGSTALVVGAEDRGLDACWRAAAGDRLVAIPLAPGTVDSLNAATAAAVLLYEVLRQRSAQVREAAVPPAAGR